MTYALSALVAWTLPPQKQEKLANEIDRVHPSSANNILDRSFLNILDRSFLNIFAASFAFGMSLPAIEILLNQKIQKKLIKQRLHNEQSLVLALIKAGTAAKILFGTGIVVITCALNFFSIHQTQSLSIAISFMALIAMGRASENI